MGFPASVTSEVDLAGRSRADRWPWRFVRGDATDADVAAQRNIPIGYCGFKARDMSQIGP